MRSTRALLAAVCAAIFPRCSDAPSGAGALIADPVSVDFGRIAFGGAGRREVLLKNAGGATILLRDLKISPSLEGELRVDGLPAQLLIDQSHVIDVVLEPSAPGAREGSITLQLEQATQSELVIPVRAAAESPNLRVTPLEIDFGRVRLAETRSATITLTNTSDRDRQIRVAAFDPGSSSAFRVELGASRTLRAGGSVQLQVTFQPLEPGPHQARVAFDDGTLATSAALVLRGESILAPVGFEPGFLDFFGVPVGSVRVRSFDLINLTPIAQRVRSWHIEGATNFQIELPPPPFDLEPAASLRFEGRFAPLEGRRYLAKLVLEIEGEPAPVEVDIAGNGAIRGEPALAVFPDELFFGPIESGREARLPLWIASVGMSPLSIESLSIDPPDAPFRIEAPIAIPASLPPGDRHKIEAIAIGPPLGPDSQATLHLRGADPAGERVVTLRARGFSGPVPRLYAPERIDLGSAVVGLRHGRVVPISNIGTATLTINAIELVDDVERRFDLALPSAWTFPLQLAPGASLRIPITFGESGDLVTRTGWLLIRSDDPYAPEKSTGMDMRAVRPRAIDLLRVCLLWSERGHNLDLHVAPSGVSFFDAPRALSFCSPSPDLGVTNDPTDDPILRIDAVDRATEECVELSSAPSGEYALAADFVRQTEAPGVAVDVRLELRSAGQVIASRQRRVAVGLRWAIGTVTWDRDRVDIALDGRTDPLFEPETRDCY